MFGGRAGIRQVPKRYPQGLRHLGRIGPIDGICGHREDEGGDCKLWSAPNRLDVVEPPEQHPPGEEIDTDLLHRFPDRG